MRGRGSTQSVAAFLASSDTGLRSIWPKRASSARCELPVVVLDASAAVEIAVWTTDGRRLADHVQAADEVVVPDHFHLECGSALRRLEFRGELIREDTQAAFGQLLALRVRRVDTIPLLQEAWAMRHNVTLADAL